MAANTFQDKSDVCCLDFLLALLGRDNSNMCQLLWENTRLQHGSLAAVERQSLETRAHRGVAGLIQFTAILSAQQLLLQLEEKASLLAKG
jgi:hypothetical protein